MKFIQNLSFKLKLLLIAIPPLISVIIYSAMFVFNLMDEKNNLETNKTQIQEIEALSNLASCKTLP